MKVFTIADKNIIFKSLRLAITQPKHTFMLRVVMRTKGNWCQERRLIMTSNQIAFNQHIETNRHNVEMERLEGMKAAAATTSAEASHMQARAAMRQADVASSRQIEDARHNQSVEAIQMGQLQVQKSLADVQNRTQQEQVRHNKAAEALQFQQIATTEKVGMAQASASFAHAAAAGRSADAALYQAKVAEARQQEDARHNMVAESIGRVNSRAAYKSALAAQDSAEAALRRAKTAEELAPSEKWRNYATGASSVVQAVTSFLPF